MMSSSQSHIWELWSIALFKLSLTNSTGMAKHLADTLIMALKLYVDNHVLCAIIHLHAFSKSVAL